ncbi:MAG: hypothetical protein AAGC57_18455 [Pseudomonadota bacterium]
MNAQTGAPQTLTRADRDAVLRQRLGQIAEADPRSRGRSDAVAEDHEGVDPRTERITDRQPAPPTTGKRGMRPGQIFAIVLLGLTLAGGAWVLTRAPAGAKIEPASVEGFAQQRQATFGRMMVGTPEPEQEAAPAIVAAAAPEVRVTERIVETPQPVDLSAITASAEARVLEAEERQRAAEAQVTEAKIAIRGLKGDIERLEALLQRAERDKQTALDMQSRAHDADMRALRAELEARAAMAPSPAADAAAAEARLRELERLRALREAQRQSDSLIFDESRPTSRGVTY